MSVRRWAKQDAWPGSAVAHRWVVGTFCPALPVEWKVCRSGAVRALAFCAAREVWGVGAAAWAPAVGAAASPATVRVRAGRATERSLRRFRLGPLGRDSRMGYCLHGEVGFLALVGQARDARSGGRRSHEHDTHCHPEVE